METNEPAPHGGRACLHCGEAIPHTRATQAKHCSEDCARRKATKIRRILTKGDVPEVVRNYYHGDDEKRLESKRACDARIKAKKRAAIQAGTSVGILAYKQRMLSAARSRAKQAGVPFNLTTDDLHIPDRCPVLGLEIKFGVGSPTDNSPSLDKIIPRLGYVVGNCEVISHRANSLKRDATIQEMRQLADYYEAKMSSGDWMLPPAR